jgi:hypothetical protein
MMNSVGKVILNGLAKRGTWRCERAKWRSSPAHMETLTTHLAGLRLRFVDVEIGLEDLQRGSGAEVVHRRHLPVLDGEQGTA